MKSKAKDDGGLHWDFSRQERCPEVFADKLRLRDDDEPATKAARLLAAQGVIYVASATVRSTIENLIGKPPVAQRYFKVDGCGLAIQK
jgi:hypothetical protein